MSFFRRIKLFFQSLFVKPKQINEKSSTGSVTKASLQDFIHQKKQNEYQKNKENIVVRVSDGDGLGIQGPIGE